MKKLSAVQLKQQALVFSVADSLEAQALEELNGMQQCWFDVQYHQFPGSLLLRFQFENEEAVSNAEPELKKWQRKLSAALLKKGVVLKDMRRHLVFTTQGPEDIQLLCSILARFVFGYKPFIFPHKVYLHFIR